MIVSDLFQPIEKYSKVYNLPPALLYAIADKESTFNPFARGKSGEYGMFQLMPATARGYGWSEKEDLNNPEINTKYASAFINHLYKKYKENITDVLSAYNVGETKFKRPYINPTYVKIAYAKYLKYTGMGLVNKIIPYALAFAGIMILIGDEHE